MSSHPAFLAKHYLRALKTQVLLELSGWNDAVCSPATQKTWMRVSGGRFTAGETKALEVFSLAMRRAPKNAWFLVLAAEQNPMASKKWEYLLETIAITQKELEHRIDCIIDKFLPRVVEVEKEIKEHASPLAGAVEILSTVFQIKALSRSIPVSILLPPSAGFSAWAYGEQMILFPGMRGKSLTVFPVLLHEYAHIALKHNPHIKRALKQELKRLSSKEHQVLYGIAQQSLLPGEAVLEELLVSSFLPEGRLRTLLFPGVRWSMSKQADGLEKARNRVAKHMAPVVEQRYKNKMSFSQYEKSFQCAVREMILKVPVE